MITSFKHKGLKKFFTKDDGRKLAQDHIERIGRMLDVLDAAKRAQDMNLPGYDFHELKGDRKGTYSVTVSGNWRMTFQFAGEDATDVDYEDYH